MLSVGTCWTCFHWLSLFSPCTFSIQSPPPCHQTPCEPLLTIPYRFSLSPSLERRALGSLASILFRFALLSLSLSFPHLLPPRQLWTFSPDPLPVGSLSHQPGGSHHTPHPQHSQHSSPVQLTLRVSRHRRPLSLLPLASRWPNPLDSRRVQLRSLALFPLFRPQRPSGKALQQRSTDMGPSSFRSLAKTMVAACKKHPKAEVRVSHHPPRRSCADAQHRRSLLYKTSSPRLALPLPSPASIAR